MKILFRADATVEMGTGHVMRCLALAQACIDSGGQASFAMQQTTPAIERRLREENLNIVRVVSSESPQDAESTSKYAADLAADWVVVDGYQFGSDYQRTLKSAGIRTLFLDDVGQCERYFADLVLNQNPHATPSLYADRAENSRLLLGPRFTLLRREFKASRGWSREIAARGRKVLITSGGSDPAGLTERALSAFVSLQDPEAEAAVVVGGSHPDISAIERSAAASRAKIQVLRDAKDMAKLMAWADVAVSAAGSTCYEFCLLGLPAIVIDVAANQRPLATELSKRGVARYLGSGNAVTSERIALALADLLRSREERAAMSKRGQELIDGCGAERVLAAMQGIGLRLRSVTPGDCKLLWEWANEPEARANSFSTALIPWEEHQRWFAGKMGDPTARMFLVDNGQTSPVGLIRYQIKGERATVSVNVARDYRNRGYGRSLLATGTEEIFRLQRINFIDAYVKPGNIVSANLFDRAGFRRVETQSKDRIHFVLERSDS